MVVTLGTALAIAGSALPAGFAQDTAGTPAATVTPEPDAPRLELKFEEFNDSGVSGTATLYEAGDRTIVELDLEDTGDDHPAYIHATSCEDLEPEPAYLLQNVGREGQSTSVVDAPLDDLIDGDFAIDLRLAPNELGTLIVCAEIEGEPQAPSASGTPGATPEATATEAAEPTATATEDVTDAAATETPDEPEPTAVPTEAAIGDVTNPLDGTGGAVNDSEDAASAPLPRTGDLDVTGTAVLTAIDDDTTRISVVLSGDAVTGDPIVHLHDGTCDEPGDVTIDLDPIDADGMSESDVDLSLDELLGDGYFINVHQSEAAYDTWLVCGGLADATVGMVVPEVAPETGASGSSGDETPVADPTTVPEDETAVGDAATGTANETPRAGDAIVTTPESTAVPAAVAGDGTSGDAADPGKGAPINVIGDGTSGDVGNSGKGIPVDPITGLPRTTGTGPLLSHGNTSLDRAMWISSALALLSLAAGFRVRLAGSRRSTTITRPPSGWTLPDI